MADEATSGTPESPVKVKRRRRRLYEAPVDDGNAPPPPPPPPPQPLPIAPVVPPSKQDDASAIVKNYTWWAMGGGLIPVPLLDIAAVTAIQLKMITRLCQLYEMKFVNQRGKAVIAALIGGTHSRFVASGLLVSIGRLVPVIGWLGATFAMPVAAGAFTYAIGKVFVQHFESGGTFLSFDPSKVREHFVQEYNDGLKVAAQFKQKPKEPV